MGLGKVDAAGVEGDNWGMMWEVEFHPDFRREVDEMSDAVQDALSNVMETLFIHGPSAKRPAVGTLRGSRFANMKELRFNADGGVWRVAFAFDPRRRAVLLVAGDKSGVSQRRFYRGLIRTADRRFQNFLDALSWERQLK